jgi:hypothetical protein
MANTTIVRQEMEMDQTGSSAINSKLSSSHLLRQLGVLDGGLNNFAEL